MAGRIRVSTLTTAVPYDAVDGGEEDRNYGFKDLRKNPESIDEIPELADSRAFRGLIEAINLPAGRFWSLACEKALSRSDEKPGFAWRVNGYVAVAFEFMPWNSVEEHFETFVSRASAYLDPRCPDDAIYFSAELAPTHYREADLHGWSLVLWTGAYGVDEADAKARWEAAVSLFADFFVHEAATAPPERTITAAR